MHVRPCCSRSCITSAGKAPDDIFSALRFLASGERNHTRDEDGADLAVLRLKTSVDAAFRCLGGIL